MKLLLDENLSRRIVPLLQTDYPDSSQVALLQLETATLRTLLDRKAEILAVLLQADKSCIEIYG